MKFEKEEVFFNKAFMLEICVIYSTFTIKKKKKNVIKAQVFFIYVFSRCFEKDRKSSSEWIETPVNINELIRKNKSGKQRIENVPSYIILNF